MTSITADYDRETETAPFILKMNEILSYFPKGYLSGYLSINPGREDVEGDRSVWLHGSFPETDLSIHGYVHEGTPGEEPVTSFWVSRPVDGRHRTLGDASRFSDSQLQVSVVRMIVEHYAPEVRQKFSDGTAARLSQLTDLDHGLSDDELGDDVTDRLLSLWRETAKVSQELLAKVESMDVEYGFHLTGYPTNMADWRELCDEPADQWGWFDTREERDEVGVHQEDEGYTVTYHKRTVSSPIEDECEEL